MKPLTEKLLAETARQLREETYCCRCGEKVRPAEHGSRHLIRGRTFLLCSACAYNLLDGYLDDEGDRLRAGWEEEKRS